MSAGRRIILPPTITGSPRYHNECFQNSMAVVRHMGKPDYLITFTTNPNWQDIQEALLPGEKPSDRPDICARVFKMKHDSLMDDMIIKKQALGKIRAYSSTTEWQKRGLTNSHNLFIMDNECKPQSPESIDKVISCEIPKKN